MQRSNGASVMIVLLCMAILWTGCAGSGVVPPEEPAISFPDWYSKVPEDPDHIYAAAMAKSRDVMLVTDMAELRGMSQIASRIESRVSRLLKDIRDEVGAEEDLDLKSASASVAESVSSAEVKGARVALRETRKSGSCYYAFVLMEVPIWQVNIGLVGKIEADENMYMRFRSSQAFKELEQEVNKYEETRRDQ